MLAVVCSPSTLLQAGVIRHDVVDVLKVMKAAHNAVAVISNNPKPAWFDSEFVGSNIQFIQNVGRQDGKIIKENLAHLKIKPHDFLVIAGDHADIEMGKNGGAVVVAAGWSGEEIVKKLAIQVNDGAELKTILEMCAGWNGSWWFSGTEHRYGIKVLSNLSSYGHGLTQADFSSRVTRTVKTEGGARLKALLAITARSLMMDNIANESDLAFGVYPSSNSTNSDAELLSDFTHRLRTTVSRVRFAKREFPLFVRHTGSPTRHSGSSANRVDPASQILSIHVNPVYAGKLTGRHVVVVDDCATYGVSFGVSAALLRKAGAAKVTCIALGKFGNQLNYYEIDVTSNPYKPIIAGNYNVTVQRPFSGTVDSSAQYSLISLVP